MSKSSETKSREIRESSPERLLEIFSRVSGMRPVTELITSGASKYISREAKLGQVVGAIIVGSCTNSKNNPNDLDVLIVLAGEPNPRAQAFVEEVRQVFDNQFSELTGRCESGRLDFLGFVKRDLSALHPAQFQALQEAEEPIVFSYNLGDARYISEKLS